MNTNVTNCFNIQTKRIAIFVDGNNLFYTQKKLGWSVDLVRLLNYCKKFGSVIEASYYTGVSKENNQIKFNDFLAYSGYTLVPRPVKTIRDPDGGGVIQKANLDTDIVADMFNAVDLYDTAILVSGDCDFERAILHLKSRGKEIKVLSTQGIVATELVHTVGINYIDLNDIKAAIERVVLNTAKVS